MINAIITGIFSLIISLVNVIMLPIDTAIETLLPDLSSALSSIGSLLSLITQGLGWVISLSGLSSTALSLIVSYYIFKLTAPLTFYLVKSALAWYNKLKI